MKAFLYRFLVLLTLVSWKLCLVGCGTTGGTKFQKLLPEISADEVTGELEGRFTHTKVIAVGQTVEGDKVTVKELDVFHKNPWVTFKLKAKNWVRKITDTAPSPSSPVPRSRRPGKRKERRKAPRPEWRQGSAAALPRRGTHPWRGEPVAHR